MSEPEAHSASQPAAAPYFAVSTGKLGILSFFSFGLYEIYWFYQQWRRERARTGEDLWPLPRAIFAVIFSYSLFRRIRTRALNEHLLTFDSPGGLAIAFFLIGITASRLPDPYWLLSLLTFLPLLPVQAAANRINQRAAPEALRNDTYTGANIVLIVVGAIFLFLIILGMLTP